MQTYQGSCHCGAVTFEVTGTYDEVHICGRPRMNPDINTINIRCLDEFEQIMSQSRQIHFDGKHHPLDD